MTLSKLVAASGLALALLSSTHSPASSTPICTPEKAAKSAAAKATVGVGGRCDTKEAAKDSSKKAVGVEDKGPIEKKKSKNDGPAEQGQGLRQELGLFTGWRCRCRRRCRGAAVPALRGARSTFTGVAIEAVRSGVSRNLLVGARWLRQRGAGRGLSRRGHRPARRLAGLRPDGADHGLRHRPHLRLPPQPGGLGRPVGRRPLSRQASCCPTSSRRCSAASSAGGVLYVIASGTGGLRRRRRASPRTATARTRRAATRCWPRWSARWC